MTIVKTYTPHLHAQLYRENSSEQEKLAWRAISMAHFEPTDKILDVGCADGRITAALKKLLPDSTVKGIDASTEMIDCCHQLFSGIDNIIFEHGYSLLLSDDQLWDWITCFSSLHWIRDPELALANFYRGLKPGGMALIVTYPAESPYYTMLQETMDMPKWSHLRETSGLLSWRTTEQYRTAVKEMGYTVVKTLMEDRLIGFDSLVSFQRFVKGWIGCMVSCSDEEEDLLIKDITENAKRKFINRGDSKLHLPYRCLILMLQRPVHDGS